MTDDNEPIIQSPVERGAAVIRGYVLTLPETPGVYRMLNTDGDALYVGKAKALKKRVVSYTRPAKLPYRLQRMISQTVTMEFVHTATEAEALLLESNLIKKLKPKYNILLRDDKSFPYILLTDHDFPLVTKHRGAKKPKGQYFGPFAGAGDVNRTINTLQRIFMLRNCSDSVFENRSRPCLQYHIKRCTAPCVGLVSAPEYADQVADAHDFLAGKNADVQKRLSAAMDAASVDQEYERAAGLRDRIAALSAIQARQDINIEGVKNADVAALVQTEGHTCVQVFFFRGGRNYGNRAYFPRAHKDDPPAQIMGAFLAQFYENKPIPKVVITNVIPDAPVVLMDAFAARQETSGAVRIVTPQRGKRLKMVQFVTRNAEAALAQRLAARASELRNLTGIANVFELNDPPKRIEVYDNSHISGTNMVGAMIVAGREGFDKKSYRKFNIRDASAGDDYAMMREVLTRRFKGIKTGALKVGAPDFPDVLLIDGGKGQYSAVRDVLDDYGIFDELTLVAIAKGVDRHAGRETFFMDGRTPFTLDFNDPTMQYLQRLRDEAHRFAVMTHRTRRKKAMEKSPLDDIPGVGAKRKKALLAHFGSAKAVQGASVADLQKIEGISKIKAQEIYDWFR